MPGLDRRGSRASAFASAVVALAATFAGCGSVGDPLPPLANLPSPVEDLAARQIDREIAVSWTWPLRTTEGVIARRLGGFTLWAVDVPDFSALTPETIDEYRRELVVLGAEELGSAEPGDRVEVELPLDGWELGLRTLLVVTAWNRVDRDAGYSNQARIQPLEPPAGVEWAPPDITPEGVLLAWRPAARAEDYRVERAMADSIQFSALARVAGTEFLDRSIEWGTPYRYRLRPYRSSEAGSVEGPVSEAREVLPVDRFAPAQPQGLRAVRAAASVELSWLPNREDDLAGYRVLRDGATLSGLLASASYSDASAVADTAYEYAVTAVDRNGNESPGSALAQVPAVEGTGRSGRPEEPGGLPGGGAGN